MTDHLFPEPRRPLIEYALVVILCGVTIWAIRDHGKLEGHICREIDWKSPTCEKAKEARLGE